MVQPIRIKICKGICSFTFFSDQTCGRDSLLWKTNQSSKWPL